MASQSPVAKETKEQQARNYVNGWAAMTLLMHQGKSWSGNERNCSYLNMADGTFADVSALGGLDFIDDGRSLAVTDWDGDGALDMWLKNRTGPQLRFLHNNRTADHHFIAFKLTGKTCNRDAIGARVTVEAGGRKMMRTLMAGEGYLSQSSKWLHFGLGKTDSVDAVEINWPDGKRQKIEPLPVDRRYRIEQNGPAVAVANDRSIALAAKPADVPDHSGAARIVLKVPLPMPPGILEKIGHRSSGPVTLVNLWAHWCSPCREELSSIAKHVSEFDKAGLRVIAMNVDKPADREKAKKWFNELVGSSQEADGRLMATVAQPGFLETLDAVFQHVRDKEGSWSLPTSFLIDPKGFLQIVYLGPVSTDQLLADTRSYGQNAVSAHLRGPFPGRWYFRMDRNLPDLAKDLSVRGRKQDADFYERLIPDQSRAR